MKGNYIDFHAHILPGADHGSDGPETSTKQLKLAESAGIGCIVATPHFYPDRHSTKSFFERRERSMAELLQIKTDIDIICASEVQLCEGLQDLPELNKLSIGGSAYILIEMPAPPWNDRLIEALMDIKPLRGLKVILAHVERYDYNDIEALFRLGLKGQLNASAFGSFGKRRRYRGWIDDGYVIALGSDIHGEGRAYDEYLHTMNILGERGQRLQQSMHSLIYKKEIRL